MIDDDRQSEHQREQQDDRLHELDVRARMHPAQRGIERRRREQRDHRPNRRPAKDRRCDLAHRLELRGQIDRVGDDDQRGGESMRALAGEPFAYVVGHRQRTEPAQLRGDEDGGDDPARPEPEPDPDPAHAGQIVPAERADERSGADLGRREHRATHPRPDGAAGGEKVLFRLVLEVTPDACAEYRQQVDDRCDEQNRRIGDHRFRRSRSRASARHAPMKYNVIQMAAARKNP